MTTLTEADVEQATLYWLPAIGWQIDTSRTSPWTLPVLNATTTSKSSWSIVCAACYYRNWRQRR